MHLFIIFLLHVRVLPTICTTCDIYKFIMLEKYANIYVYISLFFQALLYCLCAKALILLPTGNLLLTNAIKWHVLKECAEVCIYMYVCTHNIQVMQTYFLKSIYIDMQIILIQIHILEVQKQYFSDFWQFLISIFFFLIFYLSLIKIQQYFTAFDNFNFNIFK